MLRRLWILAALLLLPLAACGTDDATPADGDEPAAESDESTGVVVTGDGWTATFPGEVETASDPIPLPGGAGTTSAESTVWESSSEAVSVVTTDFPTEIIEMVDTATLLEGTVSGANGTLIEDAAVLDADGTFQGRDAVVYEASQSEITTTSLAFVDGARLYQVIHVSRGGGTDSWQALIASLELAG